MPDIASIFASTLNAMDPKQIQDQVFNSYPLFKMMGDGTPVDGGAQIQKIVRTSKNLSVGARDYRETIPMGEADPLETALFQWKYLNGSVAWWDAQEKMNSGKAQIVDFIGELVDNLKETMTEGLALEQWQDGSGKHFDGIQAIVDTDNTYGGFNRALDKYSMWRAQSLVTAESISIRGGADGGVEHLVHLCAGNGGSDMPNFAVTTLALYEKLKAHYDAKNAVKQNGKMADVGFEANFMIGGLTVFYDTNALAGTFTVLNTKHLDLKPHTSNAKTFTVTPPQPRYANGQMGKVVLVEWMGNMVCKRPNRCGALTNKS